MPTIIQKRSNMIQAHRRSGVLTVSTLYDPAALTRCTRCGNPTQRITLITFRDGSQVKLGPECVDRFMTGPNLDTGAWHDMQRRVLEFTAIRKAMDLPPNEMPGWKHTRIQDPTNPVRELRSPITDARVKWGPNEETLEIPRLHTEEGMQKWSQRKQDKFIATATQTLEKAKRWYNDEIARAEVALSKLLWQNWPRAVAKPVVDKNSKSPSVTV